MKDAKGHGSEAHGVGTIGNNNPEGKFNIAPAHQAGVQAATNVQRPMEQGKLDSFMAGAQGLVNSYYAKNFANSPHMIPPTLEATHGDRYVRIASVERTPDGKINSRSAHTFIDKTTGDVLKPSGWKAPAKGARGNIHDEHNGLGRMSQFGPAYNNNR